MYHLEDLPEVDLSSDPDASAVASEVGGKSLPAESDNINVFYVRSRGLLKRRTHCC